LVINIYGPENNAASIKGFTIVIDVFRAFSMAYYIIQNNPQKYIITDSIDFAFQLKKKYKNCLLVGERGGFKVNGFDFGNSPTEIQNKDFSQNIVVHTTTAGTKALLLQPAKNEVVVGGFVNGPALIKYIKKNIIDPVNIYCSAPKNNMFGEEDYLCAEYIRSGLLGKSIDFASIIMRLRAGSAKGFSTTGFAPYTDFLYCMDIGRFDIILYRKLVANREYTVELKIMN